MKGKFRNNNLIKEESWWNKLPALSIFGAITSVLVFIISGLFWGGIPPKDPSQLIFGWGFGFFILFISYYYWIVRLKDSEVEEIKQDIQAIDKKADNLEIKFIDFKNSIGKGEIMGGEDG